MNLRKRYYTFAASACLLIGGLSSCNKYSSDEPFPDIYTPTVFVSSNNQIIYALDPVSGKYKWKLAVDDEVHATPVIHANSLWVATAKGTLYKVNPQYGTETQKRSFPGGIEGTALIYNNNLLVPAGNKLYYINPGTMEDIWVYDMGGLITSSPTNHRIAGVHDNAIFVSGSNNKVVALDQDGKLIWEFRPAVAGGFQSSPCVINDSFLYVGNDNGNMYSLNTVDGSQKWSFATDGRIQSSPIQIGGNVLFGSDDRHLYSVDSTTGLLRWKIKTGDRIVSSPAVFNQFVYFGSYDGNLYCVDIIDGTIEWKVLTFALIKASPLIYNGDVYFGSFDKNLYCLDAQDGGQKWVFNINGQMGTSPVLDTVGGAAVPSISGNYRY
jgi:outer membrane protein assembly factor BamB